MIAWFSRRENVFPIVLGITDGILTALTLGSGHLFSNPKPLSMSLAIRIAVASSLSGMFVFFAAEYSRARRELIHAERQLNLAKHGQLATTRLGKAVARETIQAGMLSSGCSFVGACLPLIIGAIPVSPPWLPAALALVALGGLGLTMSKAVYGHWLYWSAGLILAGIVLTICGIFLKVA